MEFEEMVRFAVENGASDIHLASNNLPSYQIGRASCRERV